MVKKYGVLSDLHEVDIKVVPITIKLLKDQGVNALVLNGDLFGERSGYKPIEYFATVLDIAGKSGLDTFVLPGSHESVIEFEGILEVVGSKHSNLLNALEIPKVEESDGHELVFLPGSDWRPQLGGYALEDKLESGLYQLPKGSHKRVTNMVDLEKLVTNPDKTIIFSHVPRKFDDVDTCVDMAYFAENKADGSLIPGIVLENIIRSRVGSVPHSTIEKIANKKGYKFKKENKGNEDLKTIFNELGIKKAVNGHFHESAHRANHLDGSKANENELTDNLFWNASYLDAGKTGLLTVNDNKVSYININMRNYYN